MSLDDINKIATDQITQLTDFMKRIEMNNHYDPEQFNDARKTIATLGEELSVLEHKLVSSLKAEKEKAIRLMQQEEMDRLTINIPQALKKRLKTVALNNNTTVTDILLSYAEKYLKEEEKKEGK